MKYTLLLLHTTVFRVKQRGALWLWVGDRTLFTVLSLLISRLIPDLVILHFLLLAHSVVHAGLHPGAMATKQDMTLHRMPKTI